MTDRVRSRFRSRFAFILALLSAAALWVAVPAASRASAGSTTAVVASLQSSGTIVPGLSLSPAMQATTWTSAQISTVGAKNEQPTLLSTSACSGNGGSLAPETTAAGAGSGTWSCSSGPLAGTGGGFTYVRSGTTLDYVLSGSLSGSLTCEWIPTTGNGIEDPVIAYDQTCVGGMAGGQPDLPPIPPLPNPGDLVPTPPFEHPSFDCGEAGGSPVVDGFVEGVYTTLSTAQVGAESWVCVRVDDGVGPGAGGKLVARSAAVPSVDSNADACTAAPENDIDDPHPLVAGTVGPGNTPYSADVYSNTGEGEAWACALAGPLGVRVVVPSPAAFEPDEATSRQGTPAAWPAVPSALCGAGVEHVNADVGSTHVWVASWAESTTRTHLCVRSGDAGGSGGVLTLDTSNSPGVSPAVGSDADTSVCTVNVITNTSPADFAVRTGEVGDNPASVCVEVESIGLRVFAGTTGAADPGITWTPDPGTPG